MVWIAVAGGAAGCGFDGAAGRALIPDESDAAVDAAPDVGVDAGPTLPAITCEGFTRLGGSYYRSLPELTTWSVALARCAELPGSHLATFETVAEPALVAAEATLMLPAWSAVEQRPGPGDGADDAWYNRVDTIRTPIPIAFPWRTGEPNDFTQPENGQEDFGELHTPGVFDDAPDARSSRPLCECVPRP